MKGSNDKAPSENLVSVVLTDPTLFGNDAAEDEREDVFNSYAFERDEVADFADQKRQLVVARAYKGEGKSALLRLARRKTNQSKPKPIVVARTATELSPEVSRDEYQTWVRSWKASILSVFAAEIGTQIGVAWTDDAMSLVEEAEKTGFKQKNLLMSILDRLKLPAVRTESVEISPPEIKRIGVINPGETIRRWAANGAALWLFVDDVDKNFENTKSQRLRIAAFFDACRELSNSIPELRIRSAIRPNVWAILRREFESLSHVEQYLVDLSWSESDIRRLLALRVLGYLKRTGQAKKFGRYPDAESNEKALIAIAMEPSMKWGNTLRPPHVVLHTLSKHRPRWVIELAKVAATAAVRRRHSVITLEDIAGELLTFGNRRIQDTVAEFRSQCDELDELIAAFTRQKEQLSTADLLTLIDNKILTHLTPKIVGIQGKPSNLQVAAFLFEIGLFYGRRDRPDGSYEHVSFAERPTLLKARTSIDDGLVWEIHPVFRQALEMRDAAGREIKFPIKRH